MSNGFKPHNRSCTGTSFSTLIESLIPSNNTVGIATYRSIANVTVQNHPAWHVMEACCNPNEVRKIDDDCVLWCELPADATRDSYVDCVRRGNGTAVATVKNAAADDNDNSDDDGGNAAVMGAGRPSVLGVGLLAMMVGYFGMMG
ncbi:hypothetical protein F5X99DRAFT_399960 [Biscogniauxia marginata]|nr:hypothetical protein F5X99DRAFT_399960 [Biscogniauxia marginata]